MNDWITSTARFELVLTLAGVTLSIPVDVHYALYQKNLLTGQDIDTVDLRRVLAVDPKHQPILDCFHPTAPLFSSLEWEIYLRLVDGHVPEAATLPQLEMPFPELKGQVFPAPLEQRA